MKKITIVENNNGLFELYQYESELLKTIMLFVKKRNNSESNTVLREDMDAFAKVVLVEKEIVVQAFDDIRVIKVDDALYVEIYDERIENTINKTIKKLSQRRMRYTQRSN